MSAIIEGRLMHGTTDAYLIETKDLKGYVRTFWFPRSQISYRRSAAATEKEPFPKTTIEIPVWLAEEKGVDYEEKD